MRVEIQLNPELANFPQIQAELSAEIDALNAHQAGLTITKAKKAPPGGTLGLHEVSEFLISHADDVKSMIPFVTALLQVTVEVLKRRGTGTKPTPAKTKPSRKRKPRASKPSLRFAVDGQDVSLPASTEVQRRFLTGLADGSAKKSSSKSAKRKKRR
jgi:hypothetical protein